MDRLVVDCEWASSTQGTTTYGDGRSRLRGCTGGGTVETQIAVPDHPITRGLQPWTVTDEAYVNPGFQAVLHRAIQWLAGKIRVSPQGGSNTCSWEWLIILNTGPRSGGR